MLPALRRSGISNLWNEPFGTFESRFGDLMRRMWEEGGEEGVGIYPVDIDEDDNNIYVEAELPGFTKDEVDVNFESGVLTISGERKNEMREAKKHLSERRYTKVERSFTLPSSVDESKVDASLKEGVLKITLPKREETKPRKISVK